MHKRVLLTFVVLILVAAGARPREPSLRFEQITAADGLAQTQITALLQDRQGFLWIGSIDGLYRYDGIRFAVYPAAPEAGSLPHPHVQALCEDRAGRLWVGTFGGGLVRFEPATETFARPIAGEDVTSFDHDQVNVVLEATSGTLWFGTRGGGLVRLEPESGKLARFRHDPEDPSSLPDNRVTALHESPPGTLWIGTDAGLARFDPAHGVLVRYRHDPDDPSSLADDRVTVIRPRSQGGLWIGTLGGGLDHFDPVRAAFSHHDRFREGPFRFVNALLEDRDGVLWVGTYRGGVVRFDPSRDRFDHVRHDPAEASSLADDRVTALYEDRGGILWISTRAGLTKLNPLAQAFRHLHADPSSLAGPRVRAVHEDRSGGLWIGTTKGLDHLDRSSGRFTHYRYDPADPASLADPHVSAILEDRQGLVWVGSPYAGVSRLDRETGRFTRFVHDPSDPTSLGHNDVTVIHQDRSGHLWIGTWGGGLDRFEPAEGSFVHHRHDEADPRSLAGDELLTLHEGPAGELWIGTSRRGLSKLDPATGSFVNTRPGATEAFGPSFDRIAAIYQEGAGALWLGTWGGLIRFEPSSGELRAYRRQDGLPADTVLGILPDEAGRLWLATVQGLARFDPGSESFHSFDSSDGLGSIEFNLHSSFRGRHGELFFGSNRGLTIFRPDEVRVNTHVPPVVLTSLKVSGRPLELGRPLAEVETVELDYRNAAVSLAFAALDFAAPSKNRYAYRLEGTGEGWIDLGTGNEIVWPHLEPGTHVLHVKASNNHGVWNEQGVSIRLRVRPPWWNRAGFRASAVLALSALAFGVYRWKVGLVEAQNRVLQVEIRQRRRAEEERERLIAELEAQNAELERFTYTVSHDLKTPLVTIRGFLGFLRRDVEAADPERVEGDMKRIEDAAATMGTLLDELLDLSRVGRVVHAVETVDLGEVAREAGEMVAGTIEARGAELTIARGLPSVTGDRTRLLEVFVNLIENALKFLGEQDRPRLEIGSRQDGEDEVIYVRDNGAGIDPRYHDKVFGLFERLQPEIEGTGIGLALVRRIVEFHGGRIWVESEGPGTGSTFCFTLRRAQDAR